MEENSKKERIKIIIISAVIIALMLCIIIFAILKNIESSKIPQSQIYTYVTEDGTEVNKSEELKTIKSLGDVSIHVNSLTEHKNYTKILATVLNTSDKFIEDFNIEIILLDSKGNEIIRLEGNVPSIEPGKTTELNSSIIGKYANAYDIKFVKK